MDGLIDIVGLMVVVALESALAPRLRISGPIQLVVVGVFCGFAAATVLNSMGVMARRSKRDHTGGEAGTGGHNDQRENGCVP